MFNPKTGAKGSMLKSFFNAAVHYPLYRRIGKAANIDIKNGHQSLPEIVKLAEQNNSDVTDKLKRVMVTGNQLDAQYDASVKNGGKGGNLAYYKLAKKSGIQY